jgi:hypothetical protein
MNGYICFYRGERYEVHADTPLAAQEAVRVIVQKKYPRRKIKGWDISATIAEHNGEQVVHTAVD